MNLPLGSDAVCRMSRECAYSYEKWKQTIFLTKKNISLNLNTFNYFGIIKNITANNTCVAFTNYNIYFVGMYYLKYYILIIYTKWLGPLALYITNDHRDGSQPKHVRVWVRVERIGSSPRFGFLCGTCSSNEIQSFTPPNFRVCAQQKVPSKRFKICHISCIRIPKVAFSVFHFMLLYFFP